MAKTSPSARVNAPNALFNRATKIVFSILPSLPLQTNARDTTITSVARPVQASRVKLLLGTAIQAKQELSSGNAPGSSM